jgi:hypothetical protein
LTDFAIPFQEIIEKKWLFYFSNRQGTPPDRPKNGATSKKGLLRYELYAFVEFAFLREEQGLALLP